MFEFLDTIDFTMKIDPMKNFDKEYLCLLNITYVNYDYHN